MSRQEREKMWICGPPVLRIHAIVSSDEARRRRVVKAGRCSSSRQQAMFALSMVKDESIQDQPRPREGEFWHHIFL